MYPRSPGKSDAMPPGTNMKLRKQNPPIRNAESTVAVLANGHRHWQQFCLKNWLPPGRRNRSLAGAFKRNLASKPSIDGSTTACYLKETSGVCNTKVNVRSPKRHGDGSISVPSFASIQNQSESEKHSATGNSIRSFPAG